MLKKIIPLLVGSFLSLSTFAQPQSAKNLYEAAQDHIYYFEYEDAIDSLKKAIKIYPKYVDAMYELGYCYNELKQYKDAADILEKATLLDKNNAKVCFELGYAYDLQDKFDIALKHYRRYILLKPDDKSVYKNIGDVYYITKKYEDALKNYDTYLNAGSPLNDYYYKAGWSCNELGYYDRALSYFGLFNPSDSVSKAKKYVESGYSYYKKGENNSAIDAYSKALLYSPKYSAAYSGLGNVYKYALKQYDDAIKNYEYAIRYDEANYKSVYYELGYLYNEQKRYDDAISILLKAIDYEPRFSGAREELGYAYYIKARDSEAEYQLKKSIELDPKAKASYYYLGLLYCAQKKKTEALQMLQKLKELKSTTNADALQKKIDAL